MPPNLLSLPTETLVQIFVSMETVPAASALARSCHSLHNIWTARLSQICKVVGSRYEDLGHCLVTKQWDKDRVALAEFLSPLMGNEDIKASIPSFEAQFMDQKFPVVMGLELTSITNSVYQRFLIAYHQELANAHLVGPYCNAESLRLLLGKHPMRKKFDIQYRHPMGTMHFLINYLRSSLKLDWTSTACVFASLLTGKCGILWATYDSAYKAYPRNFRENWSKTKSIDEEKASWFKGYRLFFEGWTAATPRLRESLQNKRHSLKRDVYAVFFGME